MFYDSLRRWLWSNDLPLKQCFVNLLLIVKESYESCWCLLYSGTMNHVTEEID